MLSVPPGVNWTDAIASRFNQTGSRMSPPLSDGTLEHNHSPNPLQCCIRAGESDTYVCSSRRLRRPVAFEREQALNCGWQRNRLRNDIVRECLKFKQCERLRIEYR
jgi:hypothetical protein